MKRSGLFLAALVVACGPAKMIEMPYQPLPAPEPGGGPLDVIHALEAPGQMPPLHTVRLPDGDIEYRFGIVGHMALGAGNTIVRVTRTKGVARGEVWCERTAWELEDSLGRMPHQIARTHIERTPDWSAILDSVAAIGLMRYAPGHVGVIYPGDIPAHTGERPLVPRSQTDQPSLLFEGREGAAYRSLSIYGQSPEDRPEWPRLRAAIRAVWGEQHYACAELAPDVGRWDPHTTTKWRVNLDSLRMTP